MKRNHTDSPQTFQYEYPGEDDFHHFHNLDQPMSIELQRRYHPQYAYRKESESLKKKIDDLLRAISKKDDDRESVDFEQLQAVAKLVEIRKTDSAWELDAFTETTRELVEGLLKKLKNPYQATLDRLHNQLRT